MCKKLFFVFGLFGWLFAQENDQLGYLVLSDVEKITSLKTGLKIDFQTSLDTTLAKKKFRDLDSLVIDHGQVIVCVGFDFELTSSGNYSLKPNNKIYPYQFDSKFLMDQESEGELSELEGVLFRSIKYDVDGDNIQDSITVSCAISNEYDRPKYIDFLIQFINGADQSKNIKLSMGNGLGKVLKINRYEIRNKTVFFVSFLYEAGSVARVGGLLIYNLPEGLKERNIQCDDIEIFNPKKYYE